MAPIPAAFDTTILYPTNLSDRFLAFNKVHSVAKRISTGLFRIDIPGLDTEIMCAHTMCLYLDYDVELWTSASIPGVIPAYYVNFAQEMNRHDDSGFSWAYLDETTKTIVWEDAWSIANPASSCVLDHEVHDRYLAEGEVAVTQTYHDNAERLLFLEQQREVKYYKQRVGKRKAATDHASTVGSKAALDVFAKKRKLMSDTAEAACTSVAPTNTVTGPSGANNDGMDADPANTSCAGTLRLLKPLAKLAVALSQLAYGSRAEATRLQALAFRVSRSGISVQALASSVSRSGISVQALASRVSRSGISVQPSIRRISAIMSAIIFDPYTPIPLPEVVDLVLEGLGLVTPRVWWKDRNDGGQMSGGQSAGQSLSESFMKLSIHGMHFMGFHSVDSIPFKPSMAFPSHESVHGKSLFAISGWKDTKYWVPKKHTSRCNGRALSANRSDPAA
ncbi:hypothetical protein DFH07DRAFT_1027619 [Mycena maculata]|uniref:Uncharacterized protein n=1 Tax=Mycena maculata TaxID=230809 RepID=A0AAD7NCU8_9AGAR|nr:hypothetical protein DFH07DRAFT_1027619 [Mycena maculata]